MSTHALKKYFNLGQFLERLIKEDRATVNSGVLCLPCVMKENTVALSIFFNHSVF